MKKVCPKCFRIVDDYEEDEYLRHVFLCDALLDELKEMFALDKD